LAVIGAGYIRYDGITISYLTGLLLIQIANLAFAAGQVGYANLVKRYPVSVPQHRFFGYFYLGGLLITLPSFLIFGNTAMLPTSMVQWGVLLWLGIAASGAGLFLWNKGATMVDAGTLAIMNNALIPAGILVNLLFWNKEANIERLIIGSVIILLSLGVNAYFSKAKEVTV
jgi:drug/metabolite transporter (DMT)-like permease